MAEKDLRDSASRENKNAGSAPLPSDETSSGRNIGGQRSQNDAEDGLGSSTTGQAHRHGDTLQDDDEAADPAPETDVEDEDDEEEDEESEEELR